MRSDFYGYLVSFMGILIASFVFLMGLAYWNDAGAPADARSETSCITSSGESC